MNNEITWLHLSDIHFHPSTAWRDSSIRRDLLAFLKRKFESGIPKPQMIFCTGDIAYGETKQASLQEQYKDAISFFDDLLTCCGLTKDRLFLVPGNHDINRKKISKDQQARLVEMAKSSRSHVTNINQRFSDCDLDHTNAMARLTDYGNFIQEYRPELHKENYHLYAHTLVLDNYRIGIAGFNSAWSCAGPEDDRHVWLASEWQFNYMNDKLYETDIKIGLIHHPFDWLTETEHHDAVKRVSQNYNFILHGHTHTSWVTPTDNCVMLAAGAIGADSSDQFGINLIKLNPHTGETTAYLFGYSGGWITQPVPHHAEDGQWKFNSSLKLPLTEINAEPSEQPKTLVSFTPTPTPTPTSAPLQRQLDQPIFGRETLLNNLTSTLQKNTSIALYGLSGNGKTTLIKALYKSSPFQTLKFIDIHCSRQITVGEIYRRFLDTLNNRREDPLPPSGTNSLEISTSLKQLYPESNTAFIWINDAHLLLKDGKWRNPDIKMLIDGLLLAFPEWKLVYELNEELDEGSFGSNCQLIEVPGLDKKGLADLLAAGADEENKEAWIYTGNNLKSLFQWLGGGHGGTAHIFAAELLVAIAREKKSCPWSVYQTLRQEVIDRLDERLLGMLHDEVLSESERTLLKVLALYRNVIPQDHADELEDGIHVSKSWQRLRKLGLLPLDNNKDHYLHGFIAGWVRQKKMNLGDTEYTPDYINTISETIASWHKLVARCWQRQIGRQMEQINFQRANEAFYHLLCAGELGEIGVWSDHLTGAGIGWTDDALWSIYRRRRNANESIIRQQEVLQILVNINPREPKAWRFLGECLQKTLGNGCTQAVQAFEQALELNPDFPPALTNLGQALLAQGKKGAETFLARLLVHQAAHPDSVNDYVQSVQNRCITLVVDSSEASRQRLTAIQDGTSNPALFNEEAKFQFEHQLNPTRALELLDIAQTRGASDPYSDSIRGKVLEALERGDEASIFRMNRILYGAADLVIFTDEIQYQLDYLNNTSKAHEILNIYQERYNDTELSSGLRSKIIQHEQKHPPY